MAKKSTRRGVKEERQSPGTKTYAVSNGHVIQSWLPPTTYCGQKATGYVMFTPGYDNMQWPGPIECVSCLEGVGHGH